MSSKTSKPRRKARRYKARMRAATERLFQQDRERGEAFRHARPEGALEGLERKDGGP